MQNESLNISSDHLSTERLLKYHRHLLSQKEKEEAELHLKGCELCSDALKGISEMRDARHIYDVTHEIRKRMRKRISIRKKIFSGNDVLSIVLVLFIIGLVILFAFYFLYLKL